MKKAKVYNISAGQLQSSSGLLGKNINIQNINYCKIIKGKLHGRDYIMTIVRHVF